jgi:ubiquinone/menaquinone biosynthesis C-methylase UbiE
MRYYSQFMERTPEPDDLMNEQDQAAAYAAADWSESHGKIPRHFRERFPAFSSGSVLDLGCGTADVTVRFVQAFPGVTALGVDGSDAMLSFGRRRVREEALESRIRLENHYLPDPSLEKQQFDAVISNSLLHHVLDPVAFWRTAAKCVKRNGAVLIVDLLRPADHETAVRLVSEHAKDAPPVLRRDFIASLHAAYSIDEVRQQLVAVGLPQFRVDQVDALHLVAWGNAGTGSGAEKGDRKKGDRPLSRQ